MVDTFTHFPYQGEACRSITVYFQALNAAIAGHGVLTGMACTRSDAATIAVAAGTYANGTPPSSETYAGGSVATIPAAGAGKHRYDLISLDGSAGTVARVAGVEDTPTNAANFLENTVPQPPDLPDENAILLAIICVDDTGIKATDHGNYATAGVADMRLKIMVGDHDISYLYDSGEAQGDIIYRGAANWGNLAAGTAGKYLKTQGAAADPSWDYLLVSSLYDAAQDRGDLMMRGAAAWGLKNPGSANYYLMSNGAGADLTYEKLKIGSLYHASEAQGCITTRGATTWGVLAPGTSGQILKANGAGADLAWASLTSLLDTLGSTQGMVLKRGASDWAGEVPTDYRTVMFLPQSFGYPTSNPADKAEWVGSNTTRYEARFDDTTEEFVTGGFLLPSNFDSSGTVTIVAVGRSVTAASSKNVAFNFRHLPLADSEAMDSAYTSGASGDSATDATQGDLEVHSWNLSSPGWAANDWIDFKFSRNPGATNDLTGDWALRALAILIPVTG